MWRQKNLHISNQATEKRRFKRNNILKIKVKSLIYCTAALGSDSDNMSQHGQEDLSIID